MRTDGSDDGRVEQAELLQNEETFAVFFVPTAAGEISNH